MEQLLQKAYKKVAMVFHFFYEDYVLKRNISDKSIKISF